MLCHLCMYKFNFSSYMFIIIEFRAMYAVCMCVCACVCVCVRACVCVCVIDLVKLDREIEIV